MQMETLSKGIIEMTTYISLQLPNHGQFFGIPTSKLFFGVQDSGINFASITE
jgi:hypothetical protein